VVDNLNVGLLDYVNADNFLQFGFHSTFSPCSDVHDLFIVGGAGL